MVPKVSRCPEDIQIKIKKPSRASRRVLKMRNSNKY